jgi:hypothetical protein
MVCQRRQVIDSGTPTKGRISPAVLAIVACVFLFGSDAARAVDERRASPVSSLPKPPTAAVEHLAKDSTGTLPTSRQDSIYATEIMIDAGGVTVTDRDGHRQHWPTLPGGLSNLPVPGEPGLVPPVGWPEGIDESQRADVVRLGSDITIESDEIVEGDAVCIFCNVYVRGRVKGSAVAIFGNVDVEGTTNQSAVAPFGRVRVGPEASVGGDVIGSQVIREAGGRVGGKREEIFLGPFGAGLRAPGPDWGKPTITVLVLLLVLLRIFLVLIAYALAAKNIAKVKARVRSSVFKSFLVGVLAQILFLPIFLLLLVTIIGIPVAIFLLPLMVVAAVVLARASVGQYVGELLDENTGLSLRTPLARMMTGVLGLQSLAIFAVVLMWLAGPSELGAFFRISTFVVFSMSFLVGYVTLTLGTGAVISTRFGTRPKETAPAPAPAAVRPDLPGATPLPLAGTEAT